MRSSIDSGVFLVYIYITVQICCMINPFEGNMVEDLEFFSSGMS